MSERPTRPNVRKLTAAERWAAARGPLGRGLKVAAAAALIAGSGVGAAQLYRYVRDLPALHIHRIEVVGARHADVEELQLLAAEALGLHTFAVKSRDVAASVVRHPWVAWASVHRALPDGLVVEVQEREPAALLLAGSLYLVDGRGEPFRKVRLGDPVDLPVLTGFDDPQSPLRTDGAMGRQAVMAGLGVIAALGDAGFDRGEVSEVHLDPDRGYSVFFGDGGAEVVLGWEKFGAKLARLGKLERDHGLSLTRVAKVDLDLDKAAVVTALASASPKGR